MLWQIVRILALWVALAGYALYAYRRRVHYAFIPMLVLSGIGVCMFWAGILNVMPHMTLVLLLGGGFLFVREIVPFCKAKHAFHLPMALFVLVLGYLLWYTWNGVYADGDTLNHWGLVIRIMTSFDRMPNFANPIIFFQSYPTGIAGLAYFMAKVAGYSEGLVMVTQAMLTFSCAFCAFAFVDTSKRVRAVVQSLLLFGVAAVAFLMDASIDALLVDGALGLLCFAIIAMALYYRNDLSFAAKIAVLPMCFLPLVKTSGLLFVVYACIPFVWIYFAQPKEKRAPRSLLKLLGGLLVAPAACMFFWKCHTNLVYTNASAAAYSLSVNNMLAIFRNRPAGEAQAIIRNFFATWFSLNPATNASREWLALLTLIVCLAIGSVLYRLREGRFRKLELGVLLAVALSYLAYKVGLLGMYLFQMDSDALITASYSRYMRSFVIVLFCLCAVYGLLLWRRYGKPDGAPAWPKRALALLFAAAMLVLPIRQLRAEPFYVFRRPAYLSAGVYRRLKPIMDASEMPRQDGRILVYSAGRYDTNFVRYCFLSLTAFAVNEEKFIARYDQHDGGEFDFLVILDRDETINRLLEERGLPTDQTVIELWRLRV